MTHHEGGNFAETISIVKIREATVITNGAQKTAVIFYVLKQDA